MLPSIAKLASKHGIAPLKKYGQNFIFDETLCDKIVKASGLNPGDIALEIGPGPAGLTRSILKALPKQLTVIETDERCIPLLREIQDAYPALVIKHADALKVKLSDLETNNRLFLKLANEEQVLEAYGAEDRSVLNLREDLSTKTIPQLPSVVDFQKKSNKITIIANLPYNIGSPLLISWLHQTSLVKSMTLMLQKEVVDRIVGKPGTKAYGRLSVICQIVCEVKKAFDVSPKAFYPEPKIWSSIIHLKPKENIPDEKILSKLEEITNIAFSGRRKMIKSSLKTLSSDIGSIIQKLGINDNLRAENLTPEDYLALAKVLVHS